MKKLLLNSFTFYIQGPIILSDESLEAPANATASGESLLEGLKSFAACASFSPLASWPKSCSICMCLCHMSIFFAGCVA